MSYANRRRRQLRRNPTRFLVDNIFADSPFQLELRKRELKRRGAIATYGKRPGEIMLGTQRDEIVVSEIGVPDRDLRAYWRGYHHEEERHPIR